MVNHIELEAQLPLRRQSVVHFPYSLASTRNNNHKFYTLLLCRLAYMTFHELNHIILVWRHLSGEPLRTCACFVHCQKLNFMGYVCSVVTCIMTVTFVMFTVHFGCVLWGELGALPPQVFWPYGRSPPSSHGVGAFSRKGRRPSDWPLVICLVEMGFEPCTFNDIVSQICSSLLLPSTGRRRSRSGCR